jgi:hypothetical protein
MRFRSEALFLHLCLPLDPMEEMPICLLSRISVRYRDVPHFIVLLKHLHHPLKECM